MNDEQTLERQLFSWENWDELGTAHFMFYKCVLVKTIGPHVAGSMISTIAVNYEKSLIVLYDKSGHEIYTARLLVLVGEAVR